jgi:hypothetical protein
MLWNFVFYLKPHKIISGLCFQRTRSILCEERTTDFRRTSHQLCIGVYKFQSPCLNTVHAVHYVHICFAFIKPTFRSFHRFTFATDHVTGLFKNVLGGLVTSRHGSADGFYRVRNYVIKSICRRVT